MVTAKATTYSSSFDQEAASLGYEVFSADEGLAYFDATSRELLGVSGVEFLERWDAGAFQPVPDDQEGRKVMRLVMMFPFAGRTLP